MSYIHCKSNSKRNSRLNVTSSQKNVVERLKSCGAYDPLPEKLAEIQPTPRKIHCFSNYLINHYLLFYIIKLMLVYYSIFKEMFARRVYIPEATKLEVKSS